MNGFDAARAREALFSLSAGCSRDEWVRAGMAAKAAGLSEDDFLEWSATGDNYGGVREARSVWKSIKADGGIGEGTLFKMAKDAGWHDAHRQNGAQAARVPVAKPAKGDTPRKPRTDLPATLDGYPAASADHPYIAAKRGNPDGLRVVPADDTLTIGGQRVAGWLAVPVRSLDGTLCTVQFIPAPGAGKKLNAPGASFNDGLFVVGEVAADGTLYVCEGIGQAWACARADYHAAAVVTFGAGRTRPIAKLLRKRFPTARIVIVPDRGKESDAEDMGLVAQPGGLVEMVDGQTQISAAGWLCIALGKLYGASTTEGERTRSFEAVSKLLDGARARGFANTNTLLTLAANDTEPRRYAGLAREAMEGAAAEEAAAAISPLRRGSDA
ncbi:PriCT-2 domain-containing protein [Burkholderia pseudomallei]|nr:PriCT-2 domain-containing protein [Burkholderia pseudomallei]